MDTRGDRENEGMWTERRHAGHKEALGPVLTTEKGVERESKIKGQSEKRDVKGHS